jgi:nicotinamidase-related amidase
MIKTNNTLAIVVDIQERMLPVIENCEELEKNCVTLLKGLKLLNIPIIVTQQYTKGLGMTIPSILDAYGCEDFHEKLSFSALREDNIKDAVKEQGRVNVLVLGIEAHICVLQTCLDLKEQGYTPYLVIDCIGSRKRANLDMSIQRAIQEGVTITSYESLLFELMERSDNEVFRDISRLIK